MAITFCFQICLACYTTLQMKNSKRSASEINPVVIKIRQFAYAPTINHCLESAVAITLRFQLCSTRYTVLQTKNSVRISSAINSVTMENTDNSLFTNIL